MIFEETIFIKDCLQDRGFFVEIVADNPHKLMASDNMHVDDFIFLDKLLRTLDIGYVDDADQRTKKEKLVNLQLDLNMSPDLRMRILNYNDGVLSRFETITLKHHREWKWFRRRVHGMKIPLIQIDPMIAPLVKAMNAAGVHTTKSCDGHGERWPRVWVAGPYYSTWLNAIMTSAINAGVSLNYPWEICDDMFSLAKCSTSFEVNLVRQDILNLAKYLYKNRIRLRGIKQEVVERLTTKHGSLKFAEPDDIVALLTEALKNIIKCDSQLQAN